MSNPMPIGLVKERRGLAPEAWDTVPCRARNLVLPTLAHKPKPWHGGYARDAWSLGQMGKGLGRMGTNAPWPKPPVARAATAPCPAGPHNTGSGWHASPCHPAIGVMGMLALPGGIALRASGRSRGMWAKGQESPLTPPSLSPILVLWPWKPRWPSQTVARRKPRA